MKAQLYFSGDPITCEGEYLYIVLSSVQIPLVSVESSFFLIADIEFPQISVIGFSDAVADIYIPAITVTGRMYDSISGEVAIWPLLVDAYLPVAAGIESTVAIPQMSASGDMMAECDVRIHLVRADGTLVVAPLINADVSFFTIFVSGSVSTEDTMDCNIVMPCMNVSASLNREHAILSADVTFPRILVTGYMLSYEAVTYSEDDVVLKYSQSRRHI